MQSNWIFIYIFSEKQIRAYEKSKEFKRGYELKRKRKINELRTDNGKEYFSLEFQNYLKRNGIIHNTSVAYCPQSNDKAERLNRTLVEKARCMLISAGMLYNFSLLT